MGEATFPLFPTFALLGFVLALIPIPWHLQGWNAGTCLYMLWVSLACLVEFVDSVVWNGNINDPAPIWCDISTKLLIGAGIGIPAASLCINRRLHRILSMSSATTSRRERRRAVFEDLGIAMGIPVLVMILHIVVQGHRYNILEDVGCTPDIWNTPLAYPLVFMWPVLLGCISFAYAALTLRAFWRRRAQYSELLASNSALMTSRYFRLMLLCCVEMACTIPLGAFSIFINNDGVPMAPYVNWANAHYNFSYVEKVPAILWMSSRPFYISVEMGRWIYPCSAFMFFALFGFAEEARRNYSLVFWAIAKRLGFYPPSEKTSAYAMPRLGSSKSPTDDSLPPYSPPQSKRPKRPATLSSSFLDSVIEIGLDYDLEKFADSPATSSVSLAYPASAKTASPKAPLEQLHALPPMSPETPSYPLTASTVIPGYHRPFASPTFLPVFPSPVSTSAQGPCIQVVMYQEVSEVTESA